MNEQQDTELVSAARELAFLAFTILRCEELGAESGLDGETSIGVKDGDGFVIPTRVALRRISDRVNELVGPAPFECPKCGSTEHHPIATCTAARSGEGE